MYIASDFHFSDVNVPILLVCSLPRSHRALFMGSMDGNKSNLLVREETNNGVLLILECKIVL